MMTFHLVPRPALGLVALATLVAYPSCKRGTKTDESTPTEEGRGSKPSKSVNEPEARGPRRRVKRGRGSKPAKGVNEPPAPSGLTKGQAKATAKRAALRFADKMRRDRAADLTSKRITIGDKTLRFEFSEHGTAPPTGHALIISMHGGGSTEASVNDQQWTNQTQLYQPAEAFYVAPRAPNDAWDMWHQAHIDPMFDRLIEDFVAIKGVDPNRVYLTGYSAGGDGTYQVGPRMADRWAAAAMMAGHPNEARPDGLMNTPFFIQVGEQDTAYKRNELAAEWDRKLTDLAKQFPGSYEHKTIIYPQHGHWMDGKDKVAIPWMLAKRRAPWPKHVRWFQDDVVEKRFYWLANAAPRAGQLVTASVTGNVITVEASEAMSLVLRLSDALVDLDEAVLVRTQAGKELFNAIVPRSERAIEASLRERFDPASVAYATIAVNL